MIQAVIFDMDGVLIDAGPIWKQAEKYVFSSVGVEVSEQLASYTAAMSTREVTEFWYRHYPWSGKSLDQVENEVVDQVERQILEQGESMAGVKEILAFFRDKKLKIGLATNSPAKLISVVLNKLGIAHYFDAISSSEDELKAKPHPGVYLSTAKKLNVDPSKCLVFEDSVSGIIAANEASMKTIAVPPCLEFTDEKFEISHLKLKQLSDFTDHHLETIVRQIPC
ncbi:hexitol phosphatase HxpB [Methylophaga sp.]|uniref:hexitol phosphatase HxpB n=1 Tax=Methylophaga sp. TaxID=2024840 RepID=UPI003F695DF2